MAWLSIVDIAGSADTAAQGSAAAKALTDALGAADVVTVSFAGISTATSSFVNVAFVGLLDTMSFDEFKRRIRITESTRQINAMIRDRVTQRASALAD